MRRRYGLNEGDSFTLTDLGEGSFLPTPQVSEVARLADRVVQVRAEERVDLEEMLRALDQERGIYYWEHYAGSRC